MKKVVLLSAFLSPYRSGAESMVEEVALRLGGRFDITIITARLSRTLKKRDMLGKNVSVLRVGFGMPFDKWLYPFLAPLQLRSLRPDIVHAVLETFAGLALYFCRCKALKILTMQTTNRTFLKGPIVRHPNIVTAISTELVRTAAALGRDDAILLPNGIDLAGIRTAMEATPKDASRVLFVGRLETMKGVDTLLCAFARATGGLSPDIHLRIVGDGSKRKALESLARDLEIDHRVTFVGRITGAELFREFARAEIFCGLSRSEALGNVFLEAQAAMCAVLATNVGGIPDIVHDGHTGVLVPPDNIDAAASSLRLLCNDLGLRARLSVAARRSAEQYGWDDIAERYANIWM